MNGVIRVVINATTSSVNGRLAAEALRNAASKRQRVTEIELHTADGVFDPLTGCFTAADSLLLVSALAADSAEPFVDPAYASLPTTHATLSEVLADAAAVLNRVLSAAPDAPAQSQSKSTEKKRIVAVTSCPTGIAHTFMAAEGLQQAAEALGHAMRVETQGSVGAGTPLTADEIAAADVVMIAADREVDRGRFDGKRVFSSGTKAAITDGQALINRAFAEAVQQAASGQSDATRQAETKAGPYKHLMTGVSFMLPFVVAGGLLIAIAFALGGINVGKEPGTLGYTLSLIGGQGGFALMIPALAGYIAFSIADRPGITPGMIGGVVCNIVGAGFLGGIVAGFIAGYGTAAINRLIPLPKNLAGLKPILILPLFGTLLTGLAMYYVIGKPAADLNLFLRDWLNGLQGASSIMLGLLLGGMMALDLGGPLNKAAYAFSTGMLENHVNMPMAAVMAAGMTPPLAAALSTRLFPNRYTLEEREAGGAAFVLGLAFVSEGAIPFAARDPLRVIPAFVAGSALAGAISMALGIKLMVPHGGIFVLPIPNAVSNLPGYAVAIVAGTLLSAFLMGMLKKPVTNK